MSASIDHVTQKAVAANERKVIEGCAITTMLNCAPLGLKKGGSARSRWDRKS